MLQLAALWVAYETVRFLVVRAVRQRYHEQAVRFVRRHRIQLESARFIDRVWIREALAQDAAIDRAVASAAKASGRSARQLWSKVDLYVEEIAPFFSLSAYYRFGAAFSRRFLDFCFEVDVEAGGFEAQVAGLPEGAVRVYVINHRANMDPLVLAFGLLRHVPMSYAVGEWALVWPLDMIFRAFGSYFVRRGEKDPLYHAVLERFIQLIASQGAVTGFFIEGGLSRDGALRRPRTGLMGYIIGLREQDPTREIVFLPVGLNYDRVFEDRILTREKDGPLRRPTWLERAWNAGAVVFWAPQLLLANVYKLAMRSHRKFGYAAVRFGEPLVLSQWPGGDALHTLEGVRKVEALKALGEQLLYRRVAEVIPALPVPIFCAAILRQGPSDQQAIGRRVGGVIDQLKHSGAPIVLGGGASLSPEEEVVRVQQLATLMLLKRRVLVSVITPTGPGVEVALGSEDVVAYYANSIRHHLGG
jgi:glycerol-3-phosphate O-acyltransferase